VKNTLFTTSALKIVMKPIESSIHAKLSVSFQPEYLQVTDESHMHSVPPGSESHFKVVLSAAIFAGKRQVQRHQAVYACLAQELQDGVHALALHTYTPEEWASAQVPESPQCLGGSKHN
jgi:BolA protein